jgi:C_GCAxxG_C_C family probable redox protein
MTPSERAVNNFNNGMNCAQSVFTAFAVDQGISEADALRISAAMGGGMGGLREKCGAVTGMFMAASLLWGNYDPTDSAAKKAFYARIARLNYAFEDQFDTTICKELLEKANCEVKAEPSERTDAYYKKRPCAKFVEGAAKILEKALEDKI